MSKPSTSALKNPPQLSNKSAWAKGPPSASLASPRSQSPAPSTPPPPTSQPTHHRRPSALGQGVPIKDGVSIPRSNVGSVKQGTGVTFGSIDDDSAPISSSPTAVPAIKSEGPKSFGSVPVTASHVNGKASISSTAKLPSSSASTASTPSAAPSSSSTTSAASTPPPSTPATPVKAKPKMDVRQLFKGTGSSSSASTPQDSSPATRTASLPSSQTLPHSSSNPSSSPQLSQLGTHPPAPFVPRQQQQNGGPNGGPYSMPRSPVHSRHPQNGVGPRPSGSNNAGGPPPMGSPRMAPNQQHLVQQPGLPPQHAAPWPGYPAYYYPGVPDYTYGAAWYMPPHQMPPHQQQHHPPPPGPPGPQHAGMPMSPRNAPPPLPAPGTPTPSHVPISPHIPPATPAHSHSASISSQPPSTPMSATGPSGVRLNTNANAFVPNRKVTIKAADGTELKLENLRKPSPTPAAPPSSPGSFSSNRKSIVRLESEDARKKRIAEEQEQEEKAKLEKQKEEETKKKAEEAERAKQKKKEDEERQRKEEAERQERLKKEEAERERLRVEEAKRKEEEKLEKERLRKEEEDKERVRKEQEDKERKRKEEEAAKAAQAEREAKAAEEAAAATAKAKADDKPQLEDGEVVEASTDDKAPQESKEKSTEKDSLRIDTKASMPPPSEAPRRRPGPLDLSSASRPNIPASLPSALATARIIDDINSVPYPKGIMSPKIELNENAKDGKFRYDREFLLQFMSICKEKPDMLPPLDAIGLEPSEQGHQMVRGGSGRHRTSSTSQAPSASRTNSMGFGSGIKSGGQNPFVMGGIGMIGKLSSEERFAMSNRSASVGGAAAVPSFGRPGMQRTASQGGGGHPVGGSNRVRSQRGKKRGDGEKSGLGQQSQMGGNSGHSGATGLGITGMEPVAPLEKSQNAWAPNSLGRRPAAADADTPELVDRKVKGLLNKLTMEKFDSISDQIITWANKSEKEKDGRTLIQVIRLVFEKATDEAAWSEMYARLCRKMMEQISTQVQDDGIKNPEGKPIAGGHLFRKYLLNRCQEDFERGWNAKEMAASAAASKAASDQAVKAANEKTAEAEADGEVALYSEEYYAAQKAKRQGLGLIKFIGELFKLQMLTERIMHECVKKLLGNVENPEEEEIESLCKLLSTVGAILDNNQKARAHMDIYFTRMKELAKGAHVTSRMQFMLQDVIELRERKWVTRNKEATPMTIAAVHEQAKIQADAQRQQQHSMSRGGSKRGQDRGDGFSPGADGWTNVSSNAPPRPTGKVGDLSQFGKISKGGPMTFGPSSVFSKKEVKRESLSRTSSSSNMFHMLQSADGAVDPATLKSSRPPSRKPSADFSQTGIPEAPAQRKRLVLQPRTKSTAGENGTPPAESQPASEDEEDAPSKPEMSEADAKKKIAEDLKEFVAVRNLDEAEDYFTSLPSSHHHLLVDKLTSFAVESKEADAQLVADLFARATSKSLCTSESFVEGFGPVVEIIDDIAIDAPKAFNYLALMIKGSGLSEDERTRLASKSSDSERLLGLF